ncbi:unnamed protein product, partial [Closterium sp. NIES-54]
TSPTLCWTGKVGDASAFWVWGTLSLVRDTAASKLSPCTLHCVFMGFPTDAPPWQFYYPRSHRVLSSQDVTFNESVCFFRLHPHASHPVPPAPLFLVPVPPPVDPLPPQGPSPSGVSQVNPPLLIEPVVISSDTSGLAEGGDPAADDTATTPMDNSAAEGGDTGGEDVGGAGPGDAEIGGAKSGGEGSGGADFGAT